MPNIQTPTQPHHTTQKKRKKTQNIAHGRQDSGQCKIIIINKTLRTRKHHDAKATSTLIGQGQWLYSPLPQRQLTTHPIHNNTKKKNKITKTNSQCMPRKSNRISQATINCSQHHPHTHAQITYNKLTSINTSMITR